MSWNECEGEESVARPNLEGTEAATGPLRAIHETPSGSKDAGRGASRTLTPHGTGETSECLDRSSVSRGDP